LAANLLERRLIGRLAPLTRPINLLSLSFSFATLERERVSLFPPVFKVALKLLDDDNKFVCWKSKDKLEAL